MDPLKLETMSKWLILIKKKEVQLFLGFANHYRRLIINYSAKAHALINVTKDVLFSWGYIQQHALDTLQAKSLSGPILTQFDRTLETIMETVASNQAITSILSEYQVVNGCKQLYLVAYYAKTFSAIQRKWAIHDKKLFPIVDCFRKWQD